MRGRPDVGSFFNIFVKENGMKFLFTVLCIVFGTFLVGGCGLALKKENYGAFGLQFMTSVVIIAMMLKIILI